VPTAEPDATFQPHDNDVKLVNAALHLRRPLLITGRPGSGKSSLARSVAHELALGEVLVWPINSRSTLQQGLYEYDALARLQDASNPGNAPKSIGNYLRLGPLGTAFLPRARPRVVLVDEIDKSDIDLPNDLLHVFERGRFEIPELLREKPAARSVKPAGVEVEIPVPSGEIRCREFPLVIMTSNNERDFSPAFLRRCLRLDMADPDDARLKRIVEAHFAKARGVDPKWDEVVDGLVTQFLELRDGKKELVATDQLLNALHHIKNDRTTQTSTTVIDAVLRGLTSKSSS
jgi:MoxR-like ATPase